MLLPDLFDEKVALAAEEDDQQYEDDFQHLADDEDDDQTVVGCGTRRSTTTSTPLAGQEVGDLFIVIHGENGWELRRHLPKHFQASLTLQPSSRSAPTSPQPLSEKALPPLQYTTSTEKSGRSWQTKLWRWDGSRGNSPRTSTVVSAPSSPNPRRKPAAASASAATSFPTAPALGSRSRPQTPPGLPVPQSASPRLTDVQAYEARQLQSVAEDDVPCTPTQASVSPDPNWWRTVTSWLATGSAHQTTARYGEILSRSR